MKLADLLSDKQKQQLEQMKSPKKKKEEKVDWKEIMGVNRDIYTRRKRKLIKGGLYMKKSNWLSYFLKILWVVGLIILAIISINYENQIQQTARETVNFIPVFWSKLFISIIFGLYISFFS